MTLARENISLPITSSEFQIAGSVLRAFYDANNNLVFVIDSTISENKPHALLVMEPYGNRKWDDVLSNDFKINLETIRPKVDNKYQKLDIDYTGLEIYDNLITKFKSGDDLDGVLSDLQNFRIESVRRSATERLNTAMTTINTARETIDRANLSVTDLNKRLSELRDKLAKQRSSVGHEPTKQSASKILRTESQIDATLDKISRSQKRIANAQRRLSNAESDANVARNLLNIQDQIHEPKVEIMDDDTEVKPLFDKDPEVLDDNIAFKPIEFDKTAQSVKPKQPKSLEMPSQRPVTGPEVKPGLNLSFVPPLSVPEQPDDYYSQEPKLDETFTMPAPILDNLNPVPEPEIAPVVDSTPVPVMDSLRPSSPNVSDLSVVQQQPSQQHMRPNTLYYMLLVILIILSVFTLWLYQKNINTTTPELVVNTPTPERVATPIIEQKPSVDDDLPVIIASSDTGAPTSVATVTPEIEPVITNEPSLEFIEPTASEPEQVVAPEPKVVEEIVALEPENNASESEDENVCSDGNAPDANGCCAGEIFTALDDGVACCATDECYPPMK